MNAWRFDDLDAAAAASPAPSPAAAALLRADIAPRQREPQPPPGGMDAAASTAASSERGLPPHSEPPPAATADPAAVADRPARRRPVAWVAAAGLAAGVLLLALWSHRGHGGPAISGIDARPGDVTMPAAQTSREPLLPAWLSGAGAEPPSAGPASLASADQLLQRAAATPGTPEARLLRIYALVALGSGAQALDEARKLADDVPTFGLANLVYADLLKSRAEPLASFGAVPQALSAAQPASSTAAPVPNVAASASGQALRDLAGSATSVPDAAERLKDLSAEARARVGGVVAAPPSGTVPSQLVFLAPTVRHAIAVDTSRSRLYLFENTPQGLVLKRDYYASVGKLGTAKRVEGDLRTPLGIYFVTGRLSRARLADRYGASAMVLNYPNQYDLIRGRTGSGIWLHGVESTLFSRAPLATDGCVALSNTDLLALTRDVDRQATPVIIADRLDWVAAEQASALPDGFAQAFDAWRAARQQVDPAAEFALYANAHANAYAGLLRPAGAALLTPPPAPTVASATSAVTVRSTAAAAAAASGTTPANWIDVLRAERSRPGSAAAQLNRLSVLAWHDREDVVLVTYTETTARDASPRLKRQYWLHRDGGWNIVFDGAVG